MSYNNLLTAENLEQLQFQNAETQKLLASQIPGIADLPDMIPSLLTSNYELGGNINMLPSPETDSLVSSPSLSNPDEELDLFALQPSLQEQEQLLCNIPVENPMTELGQTSYENALMSLIANNQLQAGLPVCEPLVNINDDNLMLNYPGVLPLKSQSPILDPLDLTAQGLNDIPVEALDQLLNQSANIEMPSLVPSTVETSLGSDMIDPLLIGATDPYLMNELLEANAMVPPNKINKMVLNNSINTSNFEQVSTPPHSPVNLETLGNKFAYLSNQSPVDLPELDFISATTVPTPESQPVLLNSTTPTIPSQKITPVVPSQIPATLFTPEIEGKKIPQIVTAKRIPVKTNYTYMPVSKKRSNSDLKNVKHEKKSSTKTSQKKSIPMVKDKTSKTIQKQQVKHTFVIETPGINYGKKTTGRKRKCKKNEGDTILNIPQVPQVPCRPNIASITPQKLSKIHARTTEDLDSLPFQCEFCPSAFSRKHDLKRHIKIHTGTTPAHKCKHCGKSYARVEALNKHEAAKECQK